MRYVLSVWFCLVALLHPIAALAQDAAPTVDPMPILQVLLDSVVCGEWWAAVAAALTLLGIALRRHGAKLWAPLATVPGVIITTFLLSFLGGLVNSLAVGASISWEVIWTALTIGGSAAGGWGAVEVVLKWLKGDGTPDPA